MILIKRLIRRIEIHLVKAYSKLPVKPFRGFLIKLCLKYRSLDKNKIVLAERDGIKYELDLNEGIDSSIYYEGYFEPMTVAIINKYVKKKMTVFDIGANIGAHALRLAKLVGRDGKVIAFEPMSFALSRLKRNVELNDFKNIILEKIALSNFNQGRQPIYFHSSFPLDKNLSDLPQEKENINIITLDEYIRKNKIKRIDFIKLDVDGYEYKVIQGAINSIRKFKPIMIVEFGKSTLNNFGDSLENLVDLLVSLDYSFYSEKNLKQYINKESLLRAVVSDEIINVLCKPHINSLA